MKPVKFLSLTFAIGMGLIGPANAFLVYGVDSANNLVTFDSATPGILGSSAAISGLQAGETVLGIDFRPATGGLYALGSANTLYTLNAATGAATLVGAGAVILSGTSFGYDFNPVVDRIRVTSDADQNLRLNPNNGALAGTDTPLAYAALDTNAGANPSIVGSAYTNNFAGTATTLLYGLDSGLNILVTQNPPNAGTLNTVGALGINFDDRVGFDILTTNGVNLAFAALAAAGGTTSSLYGINLATGAATLIGGIGGAPIVALAVQPVPEPAAMGLLLMGLLGLFSARLLTQNGFRSRATSNR